MDEQTNGYMPIGTMMNHSLNISDLATALAKAQGAMGGAVKDSANPFFKSKYADLESVWNACRKPLSDNGLAVIQTVSFDAGRAYVTTMLTHASGQWIRDTLSMAPKDDSPQGIGSCVTYGRRYGLAAIVGVYQTDDDGEAAQGRSETYRGPSQDEVRTLAERFKKAHEAGIDGRTLELHEEVKVHEDLYRSAWALLSAPTRRELKLMIDRAKAANGH